MNSETPELPLDSSVLIGGHSETVRQATDEALCQIQPLAKHRGLIAVIRRLADQIDAIGEDGLTPAGKLDNTLVPTYLNYAKALGMWSEKPASTRVAKPDAPAKPDAAPESKDSKIISMQRRAAELKAR